MGGGVWEARRGQCLPESSRLCGQRLRDGHVESGCFIGGGVRERSENLTRAVSARELEVLWASRYGREAQERLRSAVPAPSTRAR